MHEVSCVFEDSRADENFRLRDGFHIKTTNFNWIFNNNKELYNFEFTHVNIHE